MAQQLELGITPTVTADVAPVTVDLAPRAMEPEPPRRRESAERALRTREEHLRIALAASKAGTWERDLRTGEFTASDACRMNLGLPPEAEMGYEDMFGRIHDEDRRRVSDTVRQAIVHGSDYETEYRVLWPDGTLHWLLARGIALRGRGGQPERLIGVNIDITVRKQADLLLRESEQRFRTLAEAMPQLVWTCTPNGYVDYLNQRWRDYVGRETTRLQGWSWRELLPEEEANYVIGVWRIHLESGEALELKHRLLHRSGEYRWHLVRGVPLKDADGRIVKWVGTCTEVHELEVRERAARFLNRFDLALARLVDAEALAAEAVERLGDYLQVDRCALLTAEPATGGMTAYREWRAADGAAPVGPFERLPTAALSRLMAGEILVVEDLARDATLAPVAEACATVDIVGCVIAPHLAEGRWMGALALCSRTPRRWRVDEVQLVRDVQARTWPVVRRAQAEAAVRRANARFERAEEAAGGFVYEWNQALDLGACSDGVWRLLGYNAGEAVPHSDEWRALIYPEDLDRVALELARAVDRYAGYALEYRVRHNDGSYVDVWDRGRAAEVASGKAVLIGSIVDFTARRLAEAQVAHLLAEEQAARAIAETASRLKDEFLATVSHELRTPLHAISGWAHVLARAELNPEDHARAVDAILRNAKAQNRIIEDILDVSRIITGKLKLDLQSIDLRGVIVTALDTVRPTAAAKQIRIDYEDTQDAALPVLGDTARLQQAVWNILMNALKFTPTGGSVTVRVAFRDGMVGVEVNDTGPGIPADFLPHVFERFRQADGSITRRHGGLGLGLAIVRHIVEMHGGQAEAHSAGEGCGATFILRLPLAATTHVATDTATYTCEVRPVAHDVVPRIDGCRVLVVDDEGDVLELVAKVLSDAGAAVTTANSARGALEALTHLTFDLFIFDIAMPDVDGYALMRGIRERDGALASTPPAIALTACAHAEERARAFAAGFQCHLAKPIEPPELVKAVAAIVGAGDGPGC